MTADWMNSLKTRIWLVTSMEKFLSYMSVSWLHID